jgi:hypothetical protein
MTIFGFAFCCALVVPMADSVPVGGDYGEPRLLVRAPEDPALAHLAWPKIVATGDGTLVLACSAGKGHNMGGSGAVVSRSTDGGATFSPPQRLAYFPDDDARYRDCGNMALGLADDGAVVLLAMAFAPRQNTILGWRSADAGKTWERVDTSALAENKTGSVYGNILHVSGMGLVVFGHYRQPSRPDVGIWMSVSTDGGRSWKRPRLVTEKAYYEPAFTFAEGRFVGLLRLAPGADPSRYDEAVSDDLGKTWSIRPAKIAIPDGLPGSQPSPFITVSPAEPSKLYAMQSIRGPFEQTRGRVYLWTADAKDLQWQRAGLVVSIPANAENLADWSYPWMTPAGNKGQWMLAFYAGAKRGGNSIYGMRMDLNRPNRKP